MFSITRDFAPPFSLISPFFIVGTLFYVVCCLLLLGFDANQTSFLDMSLLGWIHMYLIGFVMIIIFGAMAQLIPVVLEVGHWAVELFYVLWPLMLIGTLLMAFGFTYNPALIAIGGTAVLIAMSIFSLDVFMTLKKIEKYTLVMKSVVISNIFLLVGLVFGIVMALSFSNVLIVDVLNLIKAHVYLIVGGYVGITIMGLSLVLLPMFGLSHGFSQKPITVAVYTLSVAIMLVTLSALTGIDTLKYLGFLISIVAFFIYFYQIVVIYKTRARKENDIWMHSMYFSFGSLMLTLLLGIIFIFTQNKQILLSLGWLFFVGFIGFMITGHLYKIVPFLVWFERFSPLVGKQKVPMLADMLSKRSASYQFIFTAIGITCITIALLMANDIVFKAGASFLIIGSLYLAHGMFHMLNIKAN